MAQEANVAASEKFELSQSEIITNLDIKEQDEEQPQEKPIQKRAVPNHYIDSKELIRHSHDNWKGTLCGSSE